MQKSIRKCKFCDGIGVLNVEPEKGVPSGDDGCRATIKCLNGDCGATISHWALKRDWAVDSVIHAWNGNEEEGMIQQQESFEKTFAIMETLIDERGRSRWKG